MKIAKTFATLVALTLASAAPAFAAESTAALPVPGYAAAHDVPGAHELPDPSIDYKVVFSIGSGATDMTAEVNPTLAQLARYVNTLAKYGVPADKRHLIVMFHQRNPDFDITMSNAAFKARHGKDNPNIALIRDLKAAGVQLRACGQALESRKIDAKDVNQDIQIDLWAMTSMLNLQMKGYVRTGN
jgi:intracellular sulfur oxidation DsrE/DsrF family protein